MPSINDSINYIFDTVSEAGGGSETREKMRPAPPPRGEIATFKRLTFKNNESLKFLNDINFVHFQEKITLSDESTTYVDYFAIKNIVQSELRDELFNGYFSLQDITESFFVFLCPILKLGIKKDISSQSIYNEIICQQDADVYQGHDIAELIIYFESFTILRLDDLSTNFDKSFRSCAYYVVSNCDKLITLPLENETIDKLKSLFVENRKIPKDNIFLSLTSSHLKHCFLELYRCIEWLYVLPRIRKLKGAINYSKPAYELAIHCIDELSWKRQEEDSLSKLISDILRNNEDLSFKLLDCKFLKGINPDSQSTARHLYSFRNQFVHQFEAIKEKEVVVEELVDAIDLITEIIINAYELYDLDIFEWAE